MARSPFSEKIKTILRAGYFPDPDDGIFVSELAEDEVHVAVVTEKVVGKRFERESIWSGRSCSRTSRPRNGAESHSQLLVLPKKSCQQFKST